MQTFDVSANILNDKLLFSSAGARSAAAKKKDMVVQSACPEIEPAAVHDRCVISKFHVALFVGIIQLIVLCLVALVVFSQASMSCLNAWTVVGAVILIATPVFPILLLPNPRCVTTVRMLWILLCMHDLAISMVMHVEVLSLFRSAAVVLLVAVAGLAVFVLEMYLRKIGALGDR
jgi:hypothetical protein